MPAIASLEDLKAAQKDLRSMVLGVFPLRLTPGASRLRVNPMLYALREIVYPLRLTLHA